MFPMTTTAGGLAINMPDTCLTPAPPAAPVPMPYPCMIDMTQANPGTCAMKVKVSGAPAMTLSSEVTMTSGMEAGVSGGVISGMIKGPARFTMGSMKVMVEGNPAVFQTNPIGGNGSNANSYGVQSVPSQVKVIVMG